MPIEGESPSFGVLLPPCQTGFFYDPGQGYSGIANGQAILPGRGFWADCLADSVTVTGTLPDSQTVPVEAGWNVVGAFTEPVDVTTIATSPPGLLQTPFFGYNDDGPDLGYVEAATLQAFDGYWVRASQPGVLDLSGTGPERALGRVAATAHPDVDGPRLTLTDAAGHTATLRLLLGASEDQLRRYALPPMPPGGLFDIRFASGRTAAMLASTDGTNAEGTHDVDLQGITYPLTIRLETTGEDQAVRLLGAPGGPVSLTPSASAVTLDRRPVRLQVAAGTVPDAFALAKSIPNPATDVATLVYAVPTPTHVTLAVYDVLGRRVAHLVDDTKRAGRHTVRLDAAALPSGTYFVRMHADTFTKTRRMTVVR
jgi:hypothetical protein